MVTIVVQQQGFVDFENIFYCYGASGKQIIKKMGALGRI